MLIKGVVVDIDRNMSKIEEKHTDHREAVRGYETTINLYAAPEPRPGTSRHYDPYGASTLRRDPSLNVF